MDVRQMPSVAVITREKNYSDLLYAWLQCNSEPAGLVHQTRERKIPKWKVKWTDIEKAFWRFEPDGTINKIMSRKTVAKYFQYLVAQGLVYEKEEDADFYYLRLLDRTEANLIQYQTLAKLVNVLQKNSINIYIYLYNEYYKNGLQPFIVTMPQIKDFIGLARTTSSNNIFINDTLEILERLGLLEHDIVYNQELNKKFIRIKWVRNSLPELKK